MSVESNSNLSAVGAVLVALTSFFSFFTLSTYFSGWLSPVFTGLSFLSVPVALAGYILLLVGINGLANAYHHRAIFNSPLYALLTTIVGAVVIGGAAFAIIFIKAIDILRASNYPQVTSETFSSVLQSMGGALIPVFVAAAAVPIISMWFIMRGANALAEKSGESKFRTVGVLFFASGVVQAAFVIVASVLFAAGSVEWMYFSAFMFPATVVQLVAWIVAAQAFFTLKANTQVSYPVTATPTTAVPAAGDAEQVKYCSFCGAKNVPDAIYCVNCGKKLEP
jgi:uncharacterized membrane protein